MTSTSRRQYSLPIWLGVTGAVATIVAITWFDFTATRTAAAPVNQIAWHTSMQFGLRAAFLLISLGALLRLQSPQLPRWKWVVRAALTVLVLALAGEFSGIFIRGNLGAPDSLESRLLRLGAMAAYAVPMLALLAAGEPKEPIANESSGLPARAGALLVRWEPVLFTIGVSALAGILLAGAFINKELAWLAPIGADTTVAACAAAAIRARWRADGLAFAGWILVCASMTIGLLMGAYAFDGPLPAPNFIGDYNTLPRMLLRDAHVVFLSLGIVGIAVTATRQRSKT